VVPDFTPVEIITSVGRGSKSRPLSRFSFVKYIESTFCSLRMDGGDGALSSILQFDASMFNLIWRMFFEPWTGLYALGSYNCFDAGISNASPRKRWPRLRNGDTVLMLMQRPSTRVQRVPRRVKMPTRYKFPNTIAY